MRESQGTIYNLSKGVDSLSQREHGLFFDAVQRLGLQNEVKQAAVALYLDFKNRPVGEYNASRKNLDIFLVASVSLAAKVLGDLRTDQEFEHMLFVSREKLVDAEERIIRSFRVETNVIPLSEFILQLTRRQIESMAQGFADRELINDAEKATLVECCYDYLDSAVEKGLGPQMSYRGRAAGIMLKAVRDLHFPIPVIDIARAAGFDKRSMAINTNAIEALLKDS